MDQYANIWQGGLLVAGAILVLQMLASAHILRHKDDVRAAVGWIGLVWLAPVFG